MTPARGTLSAMLLLVSTPAMAAGGYPECPRK
jgi:hypothetical protein